MVYSSPQSEHNNPTLVAQTTPSTTPSVRVNFNGSGLHSIAGPVPFINLAKTYNRDGGGNVENIQTSVTIQGQIVRFSGQQNVTPPGTGLDAILGAISGLQNLFNCTAGTFEVICDQHSIKVSGAKVNRFNANKTNNNWIFTADYEVELEYNEPGLTGAGLPAVKNTVDTWNIEPLEEYMYINFSLPASGYSENATGNNKLSSPTNNTSSSITISGIPQFKISRRLSAIGFPQTNSAAGCPAPSGDFTAYLQAKKWVELKLAQSFTSPGASGLISLDNNFSNGLYIYNHLRAISFSVTEGSYEVNETWLAMPSSINYVEDYSLESSTDDKYVKTVRVQGNIKGLSVVPTSIMSGGSGTPPSGGAPSRINLSYSQSSGTQGSLQAFKYQNALSGWINDIKPQLYRRACLVLNNGARDETYLATNTTPAQPPKNPIYCKENLLNIIPISTSEGHDPKKGTISYTYEYTNKLKFISGAISESISINDTGPVDVVNEAFVLGRRLGPVLQSLGTKTSAKKDVTIEVIVLPPSSLAGFPLWSKDCPLHTGGSVYQAITGIIEGLKPYGDKMNTIFGTINGFGGAAKTNYNGQVFVNRDDYSWNPAEGRYSRTVGWTYQPCNTSTPYLDN